MNIYSSNFKQTLTKYMLFFNQMSIKNHFLQCFQYIPSPLVFPAIKIENNL